MKFTDFDLIQASRKRVLIEMYPSSFATYEVDRCPTVLFPTLLDKLCTSSCAPMDLIKAQSGHDSMGEDSGTGGHT
jgi:hypothetical protein